MEQAKPPTPGATEALAEQVAELRALLATQQATIAELERRMLAVQPTMQAAEPARLTLAPLAQSADESSADAAPEVSAREPGARRGTSRRGLLRGAAAGAAAAAVAAVAVGGAEQTHAAPLATGGSMILGSANYAEATTMLGYDGIATLTNILEVNDLARSGLNCTAIAAAVQDGTAVVGSANSSGVGVAAYAVNGAALQASSANSVDISAYGSGRIYQNSSGHIGAPTSGSYSQGESIRDAYGDLWLCTTGGTPGTWVKAAHAVAGLTGGAITYLSAPIRLLDTRKGASAKNTPQAPFAAGSTNTIQVAGVSYNTVTVPASCAGAIGNLTVIGDVGDGGYAALVPSGVGFTGTANLAFNAGQVVSNAYNVGLSATGALDIILGPAASADVILDLFAVVS